MSAHLIEQLQDTLSQAGFDIMVPVDVVQYNATMAEHETLNPIETFGRERCLGMLVGHTRDFWPVFLGAYRAQPLRWGTEPIDRYTEATLASATERLVDPYEIYWSHDLGPRKVSMLHLAQASGWAHLGPAYLAVRPDLGPWFALRALIVLDAPAPRLGARATDLCTACDKPCMDALEYAMSQVNLAGDDAEDSWRCWLAVRDACPYGRSMRYGEEQLSYHYAPNISKLR